MNDAKREKLIVPDVCPNCEGTAYTWSLDKQLSRYVNDSHRLSFHDVHPVVILFCEKCSNIILEITDGTELVPLMIAYLEWLAREHATAARKVVDIVRHVS